MPIKYEPFGITQISVAFTGRTVTLEAASTPWIITPDRLFGPLAITESIPFGSSGFDFVLEGPDSVGDLSIVSSQPRHLWQ